MDVELVPPCTHRSVGVLVQDVAGRVLLISRRTFPYGYGCPAGHVEEDESYEEAAKRELTEKTGLTASCLALLFVEVESNPCWRAGQTYHRWQVYQAGVREETDASEAGGKLVCWCDHVTLEWLAQRTRDYCDGLVSEPEWRVSPGLEVAWYHFFSSWMGWFPLDSRSYPWVVEESC